MFAFLRDFQALAAARPEPDSEEESLADILPESCLPVFNCKTILEIDYFVLFIMLVQSLSNSHHS
jgi:hypothetical protein